MKHLRVGLALLVVTGVLQPVFASPIELNSANRLVAIGSNYTGELTGPNSPASAAGGFTDNVGQVLGQISPFEPTTASQNSVIDTGAGQFSGTGNVFVDFGSHVSEGIYAESLYEVSFDLTTSHSYTLSGLLQANMDGGLGIGQFKLIGPDTIDISAVNFGFAPLFGSGVLGPGSYNLMVSAGIDNGPQLSGFMGGSVSFDFDFNLQPESVPEPNLALLLTLSASGMLMLRTRKRAARLAR